MNLDTFFHFGIVFTVILGGAFAKADSKPPFDKNSYYASARSSLLPLSSQDQEDDDGPFPSAASGGGSQQGNNDPGEMLPLWKPYCFLLPKSSPALKCAMESVKNIVDQYAKAGVVVKPIFRYWGDDYSDDPNTLEQQAIQACNLQNAFPTLEGNNKGSIQAFVREPIPSVQCGIDVSKESPAAGCSNLCPGGTPSFSTVSESSCSADVAIHESGHSNCCARQCKNTEDCPPPDKGDDGGCGLCLPKGAAFIPKKFRIFLAGENGITTGGSCQLTPAALESIRAGASRNPGYTYKKNKKEYKPRGKFIQSIYGKSGIRKLLKGKGDPPEDAGSKNVSGSQAPRNTSSVQSTPRKQPSSSPAGASPSSSGATAGDPEENISQGKPQQTYNPVSEP